MRIAAVRSEFVGCSMLLLLLVWVAAAAPGPGVHATLEPANQRKPAPEIKLKESSGKTISLANYKGRVVLLDFWATWCHGCKQEIPWFAEFQYKYAGKGLTAVGVSMDQDGWKVVTPFIKSANLPYPIVLADDASAKAYGIESMPDTFLIDREGRIAASYRGLVDRDNMETNIRMMLSEH